MIRLLREYAFDPEQNVKPKAEVEWNEVKEETEVEVEAEAGGGAAAGARTAAETGVEAGVEAGAGAGAGAATGADGRAGLGAVRVAAVKPDKRATTTMSAESTAAINDAETSRTTWYCTLALPTRRKRYWWEWGNYIFHKTL